VAPSPDRAEQGLSQSSLCCSAPRNCFSHCGLCDSHSIYAAACHSRVPVSLALQILSVHLFLCCLCAPQLPKKAADFPGFSESFPSRTAFLVRNLKWSNVELLRTYVSGKFFSCRPSSRHKPAVGGAAPCCLAVAALRALCVCREGQPSHGDFQELLRICLGDFVL